jgi:hypothetical protein
MVLCSQVPHQAKLPSTKQTQDRVGLLLLGDILDGELVGVQRLFLAADVLCIDAIPLLLRPLLEVGRSQIVTHEGRHGSILGLDLVSDLAGLEGVQVRPVGLLRGGHVTRPGVIGGPLVVGAGLVGEQLVGNVELVTGLCGHLSGEDGGVDELLSDAHSLGLGVLDRRRRRVVGAAEREDVLVGARLGGSGELCGLGVL